MRLDAVLARYRTAGILVDTNLLLLYFVGAFAPELIPKFKRTMMYTPEDHSLLVRVLGFFEKVVTTPHILTEVSNLAGQLPNHLKSGVFEKFATGITLLDEQLAPATEISKQAAFTRFGMADSAVRHHAKGRFLVLTDDFRLSQYLQHENVDVFNFNHIRMYNLMGG
jgi:hypothetical protein